MTALTEQFEQKVNEMAAEFERLTEIRSLPRWRRWLAQGEFRRRVNHVYRLNADLTILGDRIMREAGK